MYMQCTDMLEVKVQRATSDLSEQQSVGDVLCEEEAGDQVAGWPRLPAVRPQRERVEASDAASGRTSHHIINLHNSPFHYESVLMGIMHTSLYTVLCE